ncbi:MAG: type I restriction endonuclease [Chloroflexota bacterium]
MPVDHRERTFEAAIEDSLLTDGGYQRATSQDFDRDRCLDPGPLLAFVQQTQPTVWRQIAQFYGGRAEPALLDDLTKALDGRGSLDVLRHGFKCLGKLVRIAAFKPATTMNPEAAARYAANRLTVTRQLRYSVKTGDSLDVVLSVNGIPVVTLELKNALSGQTAEHAKKQYREDRDPREPIFQFKRRTLVHFAVDTDAAWMTTRLAGDATFFLPFNQGDHGGAGNSLNLNGYKTAYLWEEVLARESLLDVLGRFLHLEVDEKVVDGQKEKRESLIFPRYHQLDVVRRLEQDAQEQGAGQNYLIQHSAGSGKSNSIAWTAHRLASLHDAEDRKVFDSVVVVTDRRVLDQQLQATIYQFEHKQGVVEKIEQDSGQLARALETGVPIVITTLQKFPFVTDKVAALPKRRYAVIVDEAHSSQSGEAAMELKGVLAGAAIRERAAAYMLEQEPGLPDHEEEIVKEMLKRGRQENLSFFAFTATPKARTLEVFGTPDASGEPRPFHLYSMRQAIEEGFILDVLKHYTTYTTYFRLVKQAEEDRQVEKKPAAKALARFLSFHPHNLAQKTEVMVEHFQTFARHKIGARAKAMVVTGSRLHAVRYKQEFERYLAKKGYSDIRVLVAFSGEVFDESTQKTYTEPGMNGGIRESELPERFASDDFQLLIVAEKYQTGFDQPLLQTMYVDTRLDGVRAVQTLSRLNRTHPGKDDTFVLDFVNDAETIRLAFKPYYETTELESRADPNQLYQLQSELDDAQVYHLDEVEAFARVFFTGKEGRTEAEEARLQARLHPYLNAAVDRFGELDPADQDEFRKKLTAFRSLYGFLSQVIPYQDSDLEKRYAYIRFLLQKLPRRGAGEVYRFDDDVALKYYRLEKLSEGEIGLRDGESVPVAGPTAVGTGASHDEQVELSRLIDSINERFGTQFTLSDELFFEQIRTEALADETLQAAARANSLESFRYVFDPALEGYFVDRMEQNQELFDRMMGNQDLADLVTRRLRQDVYERLRGEGAGGQAAPGL